MTFILFTWLVPCWECVGLNVPLSPGELAGEYWNLAVGWRAGMDVGDKVVGDAVIGLCNNKKLNSLVVLIL